MSLIEMPQIDFQHLFLLFLIYSFIGWFCEEIWVGVRTKKFEYRGMLYGPICPIYGFGAILIIYGVYPWRETWVRLFLASMILTSILEYFTHWALEKIFHAKWWDYSKSFMNLNGRICLVNSCAFGIGGLALEHFLHPLMMKIVYWDKIQPYIQYIFGGLLFVLAVDCIFTFHKLINFATAMEKLKGFEEHLKERFESEPWFKNKSLSEMLDSVKEQSKLNKKKFTKIMLDNVEKISVRQKNIEHWFKKFPGISSKEYEGALEYAKIMFQKSINAKKQQLKALKEESKAKKIQKKTENSSAKTLNSSGKKSASSEKSAKDKSSVNTEKFDT